METFALRQRVLRPSLTVRDVETPRDRDVDTAHVIARLVTGEVVGTGTVIREESPWGEAGWRLRWMAVAPDHRRRGVGARLLAALVEHVGAGGGGTLWCVARLSAVPFYERAGFTIRGEPGDDRDTGPTVVMWCEQVADR
ncbi:GCN5-related N-acetyltransferase [Frankia canadensis]|uniref:GCN5-related N-acetyltransferase n=1 Tax=Frankia canadensis TaxID=1836972 RepID=A0A2I2L1X3_9ACTN|nr:GNAT family N-acetyltransferase [Frankia canadensis]SNQ51936.1 GCN5-related N-acetyltransferase [Frankia canadensis]SOU59226.1 GCN5-related N-acetyltransferase [Frankia canadensis]